jgi:hypothetical protein
MGLNVALIGGGYWGSKIHQHLLRHPLVDDISLITRSKGSLSHVLSDSTITHILVATPVETHYTLVKQCLEAGKNVMCEKNFTPKYLETLGLVALAHERKLTLLVDFIYTFHPGLADLKASGLSNFEIEISQFGAFREETVLSMLGSHAIALCYLLSDTVSIVDCRVRPDEVFVKFEGFSIFVSRQKGPEKVRIIRTPTQEFDLSYPNGIDCMLDQFFAGKSNFKIIEGVGRTLEQISLLG